MARPRKFPAVDDKGKVPAATKRAGQLIAKHGYAVAAEKIGVCERTLKTTFHEDGTYRFKAKAKKKAA